jgi:tetratricopeptide (TPR) repeat protein
MKKVVILVIVGILLLNTIQAAEDDDKIKVLIDESRVYVLDEEIQEALLGEFEEYEELFELFDWGYSFKNILEPWGFGFAKARFEKTITTKIRDSGTLTYGVLKDYDVLILASFEKNYSTSEVDAIRQFVENGGGLLLLADFGYPNNCIARAFDVLFMSEEVMIADRKAEKYASDNHMFYVTDITNHPITKDVEQIALNGGIPITNYESGKVLIRTGKDSWADRFDTKFGSKQADEDEGPFDILLAMDDIGKGRAVFFGGAISFWNGILFQEDQQNSELMANAVEWLGEPGGPYKQYKAVNEQAQEVLSDAVSLYEGHKFSQAIDRFEEAIGTFEESIDIYPNAEANDGIEEANTYIAQCETGIEADDIFDDAKDLYDKREYEKAIAEYEEARTLYDEIEYTERAQECTTKVEESNQWIALREEADQLLSEAEDALAAAPSTFDPAGFRNAKSIFEKAKSKWEEYDDSARVATCQEKIQLCNDKIAEIESTKMMVMGAVVVVVIIITVIIVIVLKRKSKVTREPAESEESLQEKNSETAEEKSGEPKEK